MCVCVLHVMMCVQKLLELHVAVEGSGAQSVLVQGAGGCGKSSLLREYAHICGRREGEDLMVVHLGEQVDGKVCQAHVCLPLIRCKQYNTCKRFN